MILISRTYSEVTPESAEHGDTSDNGFISQDEPLTFRELVEAMREHPASSCSPGCSTHDGIPHCWYSTYPYTSDYSTGTEREESIHFSRSNPPRLAKYWHKARQIATA